MTGFLADIIMKKNGVAFFPQEKWPEKRKAVFSPPEKRPPQKSYDHISGES
jgi:hypothetical protein